MADILIQSVEVHYKFWLRKKRTNGKTNWLCQLMYYPIITARGISTDPLSSFSMNAVNTHTLKVITAAPNTEPTAVSVAQPSVTYETNPRHWSYIPWSNAGQFVIDGLSYVCPEPDGISNQVNVKLVSKGGKWLGVPGYDSFNVPKEDSYRGVGYNGLAMESITTGPTYNLFLKALKLGRSEDIKYDIAMAGAGGHTYAMEETRSQITGVIAAGRNDYNFNLIPLCLSGNPPTYTTQGVNGESSGIGGAPVDIIPALSPTGVGIEFYQALLPQVGEQRLDAQGNPATIVGVTIPVPQYGWGLPIPRGYRVMFGKDGLGTFDATWGLFTEFEEYSRVMDRVHMRTRSPKKLR